MKYIFLTKGNSETIESLFRENNSATLDIKLYSGGNKMWTIYDSTTNKVSFFNSINKSRKSPYIFVGEIDAQNLALFLAMLNKVIGLNIEKTQGKFIIRNIFDEHTSIETINQLFSNNDLNNPTSFSILSVNECSVDFETKITKDANFRIIDIWESEDNEYISEIVINDFKLTNEEELLGCTLGEYIHNVNDQKIDLYDMDIPAHETGFLDSNCHSYVCIKHKDKIIHMKYIDFLNSIDVSNKIFSNMVNNNRHSSLEELNSEQTSFELNLSGIISSGLYEIYNIDNALQFKNISKSLLYKGK